MICRLKWVDASRGAGLDALFALGGAPVPAVIGALEAMLPALPRVDPATLTTPRVPVVSVPAIVSLLGGGVAFAALLDLAPVVHAPLDDTNTLRALGLGLLVWVAAMVVAVRAMRGHVRYLVELFLVALGLLVGVPSLTALGLMAANSQLDHGAPVTHRATVVLKQRRDSEVYVVPWHRDRRQKVGVPLTVDAPARKGEERERSGAVTKHRARTRRERSGRQWWGSGSGAQRRGGGELLDGVRLADRDAYPPRRCSPRGRDRQVRYRVAVVRAAHNSGAP